LKTIIEKGYSAFISGKKNPYKSDIRKSAWQYGFIECAKKYKIKITSKNYPRWKEVKIIENIILSKVNLIRVSYKISPRKIYKCYLQFADLIIKKKQGE
jgi:hypothetical protein